MIAIVLGLARKVPMAAWVIVIALVWGGWQKHRAERSTKAAAVAEQRAALEAATAEAERQARAQEQDFADRARSAADAYSRQVAQARASAASARVGLDSLRSAAAAAAPACPAPSAAAAGAGTDAAAGLRAVVGQCAAALQEVATAADVADARVRGLQDYIRAIGAAGPPASAPRVAP